jgi:hypothetical protein
VAITNESPAGDASRVISEQNNGGVTYWITNKTRKTNYHPPVISFMGAFANQKQTGARLSRHVSTNQITKQFNNQLLPRTKP